MATAQEFDALARIAWAEARWNHGPLAVIDVIRNRMNDPRFDNDPISVIEATVPGGARKEFDPMKGKDNYTELAEAPASFKRLMKNHWQKREANRVEDQSNGAIFFVNPKAPTVKGQHPFTGLTTTKGAHEFYSAYGANSPYEQERFADTEVAALERTGQIQESRPVSTIAPTAIPEPPGRRATLAEGVPTPQDIEAARMSGDMVRYRRLRAERQRAITGGQVAGVELAADLDMPQRPTTTYPVGQKGDAQGPINEPSPGRQTITLRTEPLRLETDYHGGPSGLALRRGGATLTPTPEPLSQRMPGFDAAFTKPPTYPIGKKGDAPTVASATTYPVGKKGDAPPRRITIAPQQDGSLVERAINTLTAARAPDAGVSVRRSATGQPPIPGIQPASTLAGTMFKPSPYPKFSAEEREQIGEYARAADELTGTDRIMAREFGYSVPDDPARIAEAWKRAGEINRRDMTPSVFGDSIAGLFPAARKGISDLYGKAGATMRKAVLPPSATGHAGGSILEQVGRVGVRAPAPARATGQAPFPGLQPATRPAPARATDQAPFPGLQLAETLGGGDQPLSGTTQPATRATGQAPFPGLQPASTLAAPTPAAPVPAEPRTIADILNAGVPGRYTEAPAIVQPQPQPQVQRQPPIPGLQRVQPAAPLPGMRAGVETIADAMKVTKLGGGSPYAGSKYARKKKVGFTVVANPRNVNGGGGSRSVLGGRGISSVRGGHGISSVRHGRGRSFH